MLDLRPQLLPDIVFAAIRQHCDSSGTAAIRKEDGDLAEIEERKGSLPADA